MGNVTVALKQRPNIGSAALQIADVTLSASYATGGDTLTPSQLNMQTVHAMFVQSNEGGYNYQLVRPTTPGGNWKVQLFQGDNTNASAAPGVEVGNASSQTGRTVTVIALGQYGAV